MPEGWWGKDFQVPEVYVAGLRDVTCYGGVLSARAAGFHNGGNTIIVEGRNLVPDSYVTRGGARTLPRDVVTADGDQLMLADTSTDPPRVPGTHLLLGSAYNHFGHFMTEGLSRLWALPLLPPDLPVVVYQPRIDPWQEEFLEAMGVDRRRIVILDRPTQFERLIVPSIAFDLHRSVSQWMNEAWNPIGELFGESDQPRVYLSRSQFTRRRGLLNELEVEEAFLQRGFTIVHPQDLSIADQVRLARGAECLAGSAGSAMYLGAFQRPRSVKVVLTPRHFTLIDDSLISHARNGTAAFWISDDEDPSERGPRYADYRVDCERLRDELGEVLRSS
jgi:capsular polysaccharide biosynthesis protein